jgi:AcrR family transcriptional regulator
MIVEQSAADCSTPPVTKGAAKMTDREHSSARTRDAVLSAAEAEFETSGYGATTIRGIASRAGLSTGAVFTHFTSKADLYCAVYGHQPVTPEEGRALRLEVEVLRRALNEALPKVA